MYAHIPAYAEKAYQSYLNNYSPIPIPDRSWAWQVPATIAGAKILKGLATPIINKSMNLVRNYMHSRTRRPIPMIAAVPQRGRRLPQKAKYSKKQLVSSAREKKVVDNVLSDAFNNTGTITLMNGVAQGDDYTNRDGRKVIFKSIQLRIIAFGTPGTAVDQSIRYLIVYDKQPTGALPAVTDILDTAAVVSNTNLSNRDRFIILKDKVISCQLNTTAAAPQYHNEKYMKINLETVFSGTSAAITSISSGAIYLVQVGTVAAGATTYSNTGRLRLRFVD